MTHAMSVYQSGNVSLPHIISVVEKSAFPFLKVFEVLIQLQT